MKYYSVEIDGAPPVKIAEGTPLSALLNGASPTPTAEANKPAAAASAPAAAAPTPDTAVGTPAGASPTTSPAAHTAAVPTPAAPDRVPGKQIIAAYVNNRVADLTEAVASDCYVRFIDIASPEGRRIYERSLTFILVKAVADLYPDRRVLISHSVRFDIYFEIQGGNELLPEEIAAIEKRMHELAAANIPFRKVEMSMDKAEGLFKAKERQSLYNAIRERRRTHVVFYEFDGYTDYSYGYLAPGSGLLTGFSLLYRYPGAIMTLPHGDLENSGAEKYAMYKDVPKMLNVFAEYKNWGRILGIENIGDLNTAIRTGDAPDIVRVAEALQEKKISQIADQITHATGHSKIVLIAGPSSSGKTTFANRLSIQLRVNGFITKIISMDNYFLSREDIPPEADGAINIESPAALDAELFSSQMRALLAGHTVNVPVYNYKKGRRDERTQPLCVNGNEILIVEGIHALNPKLTASIPKDYKHRIYISALTSLNIDDHNRIPTTDTRLIRRIVRDHLFRGTKAAETIRMWPSVRAGEEEFIFPYQESCDSMFNSGLIYELGAMKECAQELLSEIGYDLPEYMEAVRLYEFLSFFANIYIDDIPPNSILREFIGGSCFRV